jgi:hypothetical protein
MLAASTRRTKRGWKRGTSEWGGCNAGSSASAACVNCDLARSQVKPAPVPLRAASMCEERNGCCQLPCLPNHRTQQLPNQSSPLGLVFLISPVCALHTTHTHHRSCPPDSSPSLCPPARASISQVPTLPLSSLSLPFSSPLLLYLAEFDLGWVGGRIDSTSSNSILDGSIDWMIILQIWLNIRAGGSTCNSDPILSRIISLDSRPTYTRRS